MCRARLVARGVCRCDCEQRCEVDDSDSGPQNLGRDRLVPRMIPRSGAGCARYLSASSRRADHDGRKRVADAGRRALCSTCAASQRPDSWTSRSRERLLFVLDLERSALPGDSGGPRGSDAIRIRWRGHGRAEDPRGRIRVGRRVFASRHGSPASACTGRCRRWR